MNSIWKCLSDWKMANQVAFIVCIYITMIVTMVIIIWNINITLLTSYLRMAQMETFEKLLYSELSSIIAFQTSTFYYQGTLSSYILGSMNMILDLSKKGEISQTLTNISTWHEGEFMISQTISPNQQCSEVEKQNPHFQGLLNIQYALQLFTIQEPLSFTHYQMFLLQDEIDFTYQRASYNSSLFEEIQNEKIEDQLWYWSYLDAFSRKNFTDPIDMIVFNNQSFISFSKIISNQGDESQLATTRGIFNLQGHLIGAMAFVSTIETMITALLHTQVPNYPFYAMAANGKLLYSNTLSQHVAAYFYNESVTGFNLDDWTAVYEQNPNNSTCKNLFLSGSICRYNSLYQQDYIMKVQYVEYAQLYFAIALTEAEYQSQVDYDISVINDQIEIIKMLSFYVAIVILVILLPSVILISNKIFRKIMLFSMEVQLSMRFTSQFHMLFQFKSHNRSYIHKLRQGYQTLMKTYKMRKNRQCEIIDRYQFPKRTHKLRKKTSILYNNHETANMDNLVQLLLLIKIFKQIE